MCDSRITRSRQRVDPDKKRGLVEIPKVLVESLVVAIVVPEIREVLEDVGPDVIQLVDQALQRAGDAWRELSLSTP